jgi:hypothetical protein
VAKRGMTTTEGKEGSGAVEPLRVTVALQNPEAAFDPGRPADAAGLGRTA